MTELLVRPLADAFMQVGVFVALLVAPFGWARYRWGRRLDAALVRYRRLGPVLAAALTAPPGCGGAIVVMALYVRGAVSYGSAIAALVATMGDATWVLLAADPVLTLELKALLLTTGAVTGYAVDALGIAPRLRLPGAGDPDPSGVVPDGPAPRPAAPSGGGAPTVALLEAPAPAPAPAPAALALPRVELGTVNATLWLLIGAAALVSVPATFRLLDPAAVGTSLLGGVDPYLALGTIGTTFAVFAFARNGCKLADDDTRTAHPGSLAQVMRHGGQEVAFVTVWVAVAYVAWAVLSHVTRFDGSQLPLLGVAGVVVGALVGLIPGCGVQIVFTGIFIAGGMPLSTLVANTISQDGDALLPLLALEHRSALLATVITTIPAVVVGSGVLLLG
ncbi:putative manganese transporter [Nocardioides caldifontis]|uniref:putative manganese transporter n=1 Tax=Nocardioides caldifontis TaxID=2588938 RepID=UPI0011DF6796|nr:putative manganese transporter [Nocardioides caldifontis]